MRTIIMGVWMAVVYGVLLFALVGILGKELDNASTLETTLVVTMPAVAVLFLWGLLALMKTLWRRLTRRLIRL